jgi:hypothetical protein
VGRGSDGDGERYCIDVSSALWWFGTLVGGMVRGRARGAAADGSAPSLVDCL